MLGSSLGNQIGEALECWRIVLRKERTHAWRFMRRVRGLTKLRTGAWYWRTEEEWSPGQFELTLVGWPGFTSGSKKLGRVVTQACQDAADWMIVDVQAYDRERGVGTALVSEVIALARRHRVQKLRGFVTSSDAHVHPFLPDWYSRLGFTVQPAQGDTKAIFWMDLASRVPPRKDRDVYAW